MEEELPLYTCTDSYTGATSSVNETRSYNELATLMYVTGGGLLTTPHQGCQEAVSHAVITMVAAVEHVPLFQWV